MEKMEKNLEKSNWSATFNLIGKVKISEDYTFNIDEQSEKSDWIYNSMNLGIDCGEKHGIVYAGMMGGYGKDRENFIKVHGKDDEGNDDYNNKMEIAWEDRLNETILEDVGELCFIKVGIEKTKDGKTFYKKFLSEYDAIAYAKEHLKDGMVVNVRGNIKYQLYKGNTNMQKNITSIALSKAEESDFRATFRQTILISKDSAKLNKTNIDTDKGVMFVSAKVLDYVKQIGNTEIRGQYPMSKDFEFAMDFSDQERCKKIMAKLFKVKKGYTQITFNGEFICGGAKVDVSWEDVPEDIKDLVECGVYTKEEALKACSTNGKSDERMVLLTPYIKREEGKIPEVQMFAEQYTDDDLAFDIATEEDEEGLPFDEELPFGEESENTESTSSDDMEWLKNL